MKVEFFKPDIRAEDREEVDLVLRSNFLTTGPKVLEFERKFADYLRIPSVVAVSSCTAALHLCLETLSKDNRWVGEVITTPLTFVATANAIEMAGFRPVFVDVDPYTGLIQEEHIPEAITERTVAIIPVHLYGQMCDVDQIRSSVSHDIAIIEDAAHAIEAHRNTFPGGDSYAACFSFYATKNMTSGEGGAIATRNVYLAERLRHLRNHGATKTAQDRIAEGYTEYDISERGYKYNMGDIQAALLLHQIDRLESNLEVRTRRVNWYYLGLNHYAGAVRVMRGTGYKHSHHLFTILVPPHLREAMLVRLKSKGISCMVNYKPVHLMTYYHEKYGYKRGDFPNAEYIGDSTITLPLYPNLAKTEVEYVIQSVQECVDELAV